MLLKVLNGFSQAAIITLALVLIITITNKHSSTVALEDFQTQVNQRLDEDRKYYDNKIRTVQENLNTYQQTRETRAQIYSKKIDDLYALYKKDPAVIENAKASLETVVNTTPTETSPSVDKNFTFLETRINKLHEKLDNSTNKLESRVNILEQRVERVSEMGNNMKVINNNSSSAVINGIPTVQ